MLPDISAHEAWFVHYADGFRNGSETDVKYVELKRDHSLRVFENARAILPSLNFSEELQRAALLAALYHDVGRFIQYATYKTFSDRLSENHGFLGGKALKKEQPLRDEPREIQRLVLGAVVMHNRFMMPEGISADLRSVTNVVRDSDKLDIFPVMLSNFTRDGSKSDVVTLHLEEKEGAWSQPVLDSLLRKELACYADMRFVNDFKLLLGSWAFDMTYAESKRLIRERGDMERLLEIFPKGPEMETAKGNIREALAG